MVFMTENKLVVMLDPYGFRLLVVEKRSDGVVMFGFKTCALEWIIRIYEKRGYPGEVLVVKGKKELIMDGMNTLVTRNKGSYIF